MLIHLPNYPDKMDDGKFSSIADDIKLDMKNGPWVVGGAALSLYTRYPVNDFDIYVSKLEDIDRLHSWLKDYTVTHNSENAITGTTIVKHGNANYIAKVQIIKKEVFPSLEDVFNSFDFTVCQIATDLKGNFISTPRAIADIGKKILRTNNFKADKFMARWAKYSMYGYNMAPDEFMKYVNTLDEKQIEKTFHGIDNY
jgi:hypothetical protein